MPGNQTENKELSPRGQIQMFQGALDKQGRLDHRSRYGRSIKSISQELEKDVNGAAIAFLRRDVASYRVIQQAIFEHILKDPETVISDQGVTALLVSDYVKFADATRRAITALRQIEGSKKGKGKDKELSEFLFDDEEV